MIGSDKSNPAGSTAFDPQQLFKTMQQAWQSLPMPASMAPAMDIDELDKRLAELRTVEQWLEMNLNMLRTSVQALEIQRGTLATLKAFGESLSQPADARGDDSQGAPSPFDAFNQAMQNLGGQAGGAPHAWWQSLQEQFQQVAQSALAGAATTPAPRPTPVNPDTPGAQAGPEPSDSAAQPPEGVRQGTRGRRRVRPQKP